ncbi:hypothetical protein HC928_05230 [bacterium]|nr:hypothetical protein [bacterium]
MPRKHALILILFVLLSLLVVPIAGAQELEDLDVQDIINALGPREGEDLLFDVLLYAIFFMSILSMFLIPDKQLLATMLNFVVILMAVLSKVLVDDTPSAVLEPTDLPVLPMNAAMFVLPIIIAGMVRQRRGTPPAAYTGLITGVLGAAYFFLFWFLKQNGYESSEVVRLLVPFI